MTLRAWRTFLLVLVLGWAGLSLGQPTSVLAAVNPQISTGNMSMQRFVVDKVKNGLIFSSIGTRALFGVACSPNYELDVSGSAKILKPIFIGNAAGTIIAANPSSINWSKGSVQRITLANSNYGVTFAEDPVATANAKTTENWVATVVLLVYMNANAAGTISSWAPSSQIRWAGGSPPVFNSSSAAQVYPIRFHAVKNIGSAGVLYYGTY